MSEIKILIDTTNLFVAEEPPYSFGFLQLLFIFIITGVNFYLAHNKSWKSLIVSLPLSALFLWLIWPNSIAYRMELRPQQKILKVDTIKKGQIMDSELVHFSDIARAEMQFNRGDKRIVVVLNDGKQVFPLGDGYIQNDPNQYKPLIAIQKAVGLPVSSDSDK